MDIFDMIFLVIGIFIIIGISLVIFHYKRKYPEEEMKYKSSLVIYFFGILLIMGAITGLIWLLMLSIFILGFIGNIYYDRKYPELKKHGEIYGKELYSAGGTWGKIMIVYFGVLFLIISVIVLFNITF